MKVLITGASGFVGSHLCDRYHSLGHEVYALMRNPLKGEQFSVPGKVIKGDLSLESLKTWIPELPKDIDLVIHTAGIVHSYTPDDFYHVNTQASVHLLELLMKNLKTDAHFILVSSLAAFGPQQTEKLPQEGDSPRPVSHYGHSKLEAEQTLSQMIEGSTWRLSIIRPPMVIGPRDVAILDIYKMVASKFVLYPGLGAGQKTYSFVCIYDLVSVIENMAGRASTTPPINTYFCGHPETITFKQIIDTISETMKQKPFIIALPFLLIKVVSIILKTLSKLLPVEARLTPDKIKELEPMSWTCDAAKSEHELQYQYKWPLKETIQVTFKDYQERGWL